MTQFVHGTYETMAEMHIVGDRVAMYVRMKPRGSDRWAYVEGVPNMVCTTPAEGTDLGVPTSLPTFSFPRDMARAMMTELWRIGVRPHGVRDDSDRVDAMRAHVDDLRLQLAAQQKFIASLIEIVGDGGNTV